MKIEELRVDDLIPYENNPRNNEEAVDKVALSISSFGFKVPIIVDRDNVIVAGHTRHKAAKKLGLTTVPVIRADDLTDDQIRAFRLADNKVSEFATWDMEKLEQEMRGLKSLDMSLFGFEKLQKELDWFEERQKDDMSRQEGNDEYNEFLDKFEVKKTTDDCYTPDNIYDVVASYVEEHYKTDRANYVRPFYPGGDYQKEKYKPGDIVVDNPPFSILAQIVDFYVERGIQFFLFCPALSAINYTNRDGVCAICTYAPITYENGAVVPTSFLSNVRGEKWMARSAPDLHEKLKATNDENEKKLRKSFPKYEFPMEVLTAAKCGWLSKYGQSFAVDREDGVAIRTLDAMKEFGKGIFGGAILLSERAAAERAAAERAAAERAAATTWKLSEREMEIVKSLGKTSKTA